MRCKCNLLNRMSSFYFFSGIGKMNSTETIIPLFSELPWIIVYSSEGLLILVANSVALFIFVMIRSHLKRACYLLVTLTIADLLLGVALMLYLWEGMAVKSRKHVSSNVGKSAFVIDLLASTASLLSLSLISLERMFAILKPFTHRMLETWHYIASISFVWFLSIINVAVLHYLLSTSAVRYSTIGFSMIAILSILVTVASYLAIWIATKRNRLQNITSRSMEQQKKFAKTLCIVTLISLVTWLPAGVNLAIPNYLNNADSLFQTITVALQYTNSFLNPIIYCFRMAEFQTALKKLCCRCRLKTKPLSSDKPAWITQGIALTSFKSTECGVGILEASIRRCPTVPGMT